MHKSPPAFPLAPANTMSFFRAAPRRVRPVHVAAVVLVLVFVALMSGLKHEEPVPSIYTYTDGKTSRPWSELTMKVGPSSEGLWLRQLVEEHSLSREIKYYSERIKPYESDARLSMTDMNRDFKMQNFQQVHVSGDALRLEAEDQLPLPVARSQIPGQMDVSGILFGVTTTYARVMKGDATMINDWKLWLTDGRGQSNGGTLYLSLYKADGYEVDKVKRMLKDAGIDSHVESTDETADSATRYITMIRNLAIRSSALFIGGTKKQWLAVVDDDTFFPNMGQLVERLAKYDPTQDMYIGLPSERADWVVDSELSVTYGGGAIFLSTSAAIRVSQLPCLTRKDAGSGGDEYGYLALWDALLYECISNYTKMHMHVLPSYYAPTDEVHGTNSLNYELGIAPLALHHSSNRHGLRSPGKAALVSGVCGEASFLQRYRFRDNWILINGLSIFQYPNGQDVRLLGNELPDGQYWKAVNEYHAAITMPLEYNIIVDDEWRHTKDWKVITWAESRRAWKFIDSVRSEDGREVWQAYVRRKGETGLYTDGRVGDFAKEDSLIVLRWEVPGG